MTIGDILVLEYNNRFAFYVVDEEKVRYYTTVEDFCSFGQSVMIGKSFPNYIWKCEKEKENEGLFDW